MEHLIAKVDERKEFAYGEDGFVYYNPENSGLIAAWELRVIADELDRRNADWKQQINEELK